MNSYIILNYLVESFSSTQASFWINLDVSGAAMFTPISFLSVTETVSKGLPRIWDLGDMEWSISTGTSLLRKKSFILFCNLFKTVFDFRGRSERWEDEYLSTCHHHSHKELVEIICQSPD